MKQLFIGYFINVECWSFAFYADDRHKGKFDSSEASQELKNLISAKTKEDKVKAIKKIKKNYNIKSSNQYNETSLIMVHKIPVRLNQIYPLPSTVVNSFYIDSWHRFFCENYIHLLTGDFDFTQQKWNYVEKHFGSFIDAKSSVIQIPHHGSIDNWDKNILTHTSHSNLCVIPYGTKNPYGHPAFDVVKDVLDKDNCLFEVTEHQFLMVQYK